MQQAGLGALLLMKYALLKPYGHLSLDVEAQLHVSSSLVCIHEVYLRPYNTLLRKPQSTVILAAERS